MLQMIKGLGLSGLILLVSFLAPMAVAGADKNSPDKDFWKLSGKEEADKKAPAKTAAGADKDFWGLAEGDQKKAKTGAFWQLGSDGRKAGKNSDADFWSISGTTALDEFMHKREVQRLKAEAERKRLAEERRKAEAERQRIEEEKRKAEAERERLEEEKRKAEAERERLNAERKRLEKEKRQAEARYRSQSRQRVVDDSAGSGFDAQRFWAEAQAKRQAQWDAFNRQMDKSNQIVNNELRRINQQRQQDEQRYQQKQADLKRLAKEQRQAAAESERRQREEAAAAERERELEQELARLAREREKLEEEQKQAKIRQKQEAKAAEIRQQEADEQEKAEFLRKMKEGVRLAARNCGGEVHVGGTKPKLPGNRFWSINVYFTAYCPGDSSGTSGVLTAFTGYDAGCLGDTVAIATPPCKAKDLRVVVDKVEFYR